MTPGLVIAGTHSGCGKTTVTLGLMAALVKRGYRIQGFKTGPDFIDPTFYRAITGREGENLDTWMVGQNQISRIYQEGAAGSEFTVIEGVMGLYDGASSTDEAGSTAELAKILDLPVVLVIDARSMARSVAAVVKGFIELDPGLRFGGIILNRVGSDRHFKILKEAINSVTSVKVLGYLSKETSVTLPERHLGLVPYYEDTGLKKQLDYLADIIEANLDVTEILTIFRNPKTEPFKDAILPNPNTIGVRIGIARDQVFGFYYQDNLRMLQKYGAELVYFSLLKDYELPEGIRGLYLGGGYPELFAAQLEANSQLKTVIYEFINKGLPVYAECGGLMYLGKNIRTKDGVYKMIGALDIEVGMAEKRAALGYRKVTALTDNILFRKGQQACGHEFHYSEIVNSSETENAFLTGQNRVIGFEKGKILASYVHLHFGSNPQIAKQFVLTCGKE